MLRLFTALALSGAGATCLFAQNVEEPLSLEVDGQLVEGYIDWTGDQGTERHPSQTGAAAGKKKRQIPFLAAYGEATVPDKITNPVQRRLLGFRAAKTVAYRNLLEMVGEVRIDAQTKVSMAMVESDEVSSQVTGIVKGARVVPGSQREIDGLYRLALKIDLRNEFADAVLPAQGPPQEPEPLPAEADFFKIFVPPKPYTGLLIDARGLDLRPSMAPRIFNQGGQEIYGAGVADRLYATQMGVVGYDKDMDRALTSDRLGGEESRPLVVKAQSVSGPYNGDVVISDEEAIWVRMADQKQNFLAQCRIVFLLGPAPEVADAAYEEPPFIDSAHPEEDQEEDQVEIPGETDAGDLPE